LNEQFLESPWSEFHPEWGYWKNVGINIAGFVPLGFFFLALFSSVPKLRRPVLVTVVLGFTVSLTIEVLQAFLPTRDSGMTDLITNTLGAAIGVLAFKYGAVGGVLAGNRS
jgi:glycopeptide antibiotics resistance protein